MLQHSTNDLLTDTQRAVQGLLSPDETADPDQLDLQINYGRVQLSPDDAQGLRAGSVLSLDESLDAPVELRFGGRLVGRGNVVVVGGKIGVRVLELCKGQEANP
jgi:flagellar motor switch protein FliN